MSSSFSPKFIGSPTAESSYQLNACQWDWQCCQTFSTVAELLHHVIHEHARKAKLESDKFSDLLVLQRVEEGTGESLSLPGFTQEADWQGTLDPLSQGSSKQEISPNMVIPPSSLPSPPRSSTSQLHSPIISPALSYSMQMTQQKSQSADILSQAHLNVPQLSPKRVATPSFTSLASATGSPCPSLPPSPLLDVLILSATRNDKARDEYMLGSSSPSGLYLPASRTGSNASQTSTTSQESVALQLTQTSEEESNPTQTEDPEAGDLYAGELQWTNRAETSELALNYHDQPTGSNSYRNKFPSQPLSQTPSQLRIYPHHPAELRRIKPMATISHPQSLAFKASTPVNSQSWYQNPVRRVSRTKSELGCSPSEKQTAAEKPRRRHGFRSGTVQIVPAMVSQAPQPQSSPISSQLDEDSFDGLSYPLQTQAPYESQPLTQV